MPNFHTNSFSMPTLPATYGQSEFSFLATSSHDDKLVKATCSGEEIFIKLYKNKDGFLIKGDKITRPSQVSILHRALCDFRDLNSLKPIFSNIDAKRFRTLQVSPYLKKMDYFADEFQTDKEIYVEVGFGSGRHLLHQAKKNPDKLVIGLEIHKPSIEQVLKQCEIQNITNILVADYDARVFLEFLPSNSVGKVFVHFPVPWDKKPHRRVISDKFINEAKRVLKVGGTLELRSDSDNYFEYSFFEFMKQEKVKLEVHKNRDLEVSSKYEDRWKKQEKNIYDITMENLEESPAVEKIARIKFEKNVDFKKVKENFEKKLLRDEDIFAHFEEIFEIDETSGLVRVSFGGAGRNEHNYIFITPQSISYFPDNVLATKDNVNAHKLIEEILYGICN